MLTMVIREGDIKRAVSECVAAKAGTDLSLQDQAMRRLVETSVGYLDGGGSLEEFVVLASGQKK